MKTILFDFFGVLEDPIYMKIVEKRLPKEEHQDWANKLDTLDVGAISEDELVADFSSRVKASLSEIWAEIKSAPVINEELFDFIRTELKTKYKIGLLTNCPRSLIERVIPDKLPLFDVVLISSDLKLIKPDPEIFKVAIERSGCEAGEILFIDDNPRNTEAAESVGIKTLVYRDFESFKAELQKHLS